jgi:hypothetical protein
MCVNCHLVRELPPLCANCHFPEIAACANCRVPNCGIREPPLPDRAPAKVRVRVSAACSRSVRAVRAGSAVSRRHLREVQPCGWRIVRATAREPMIFHGQPLGKARRAKPASGTWRDVSRVPIGTLSVPMGALGTSSLARNVLSSHPTLRVGVGRCAPGVCEAGRTRADSSHREGPTTRSSVDSGSTARSRCRRFHAIANGIAQRWCWSLAVGRHRSRKTRQPTVPGRRGTDAIFAETLVFLNPVARPFLRPAVFRSAGSLADS